MNQPLNKPLPVITGNDERDTLFMKVLLIVSDTKQADIARNLGCKNTIVNKVVLRKENSRFVIGFFQDLAERYSDKVRQLLITGKE